MADSKTLASWDGPILMIGFGSIGRGTLPLILRHIKCDPGKITIMDPSDESKSIADTHNIKFVKQGFTRSNFRKLLTPILSKERTLVVNLSVDVGSLDIMRVARQHNALYIDTVIEPWPGFYYNEKINNAARTNYAMREELVELKRKLGPGPTAVSCCGANPGMVSWFVKKALIDIAIATKTKFTKPVTREDWASLMQRLGVKGVHVAERDTQRSKKPKPFGTFLNTWSVEGFISEGLQPAELGWGTHEKKLPPEGRKYKRGSKAAIYLERPGADTRVLTWTPNSGAQFGYLVTHNEAISISDYYTVRKGGKVVYRPTANYAYHPCNDALLSWHELLGTGGKHQAVKHVLTEHEIADGMDELGVLLYGHKKNAYWFGSQLDIQTARELAPYQNATGLQVTSAVLAGMIWAIENPNAGIVEADEMDYERCLEIQSRYLGRLVGTYTKWTPLDSQINLFDAPRDKRDPWQFTNILMR